MKYVSLSRYATAVDSLDQFVADIQKGRWEVALPQILSLKLPSELLFQVYEQITMELIELREIETARAMLRQTQVRSLCLMVPVSLGGRQLDEDKAIGRIGV